MNYLTGHQLSDLKESGIYCTGVTELDTLLGGGFHSGEVIEIFGESGVGKSWFCTWLGCKFVTDGHGDALFIDSQSCISSLMIKHCLNSRSGLLLNACSSTLYHSRVTDLYELFDALEKVQAGLGDNCNLKLVIIDSLTSITPHNPGSALLMCLLSQTVKHIAKKWGVCVLLVCGGRSSNQPYNSLLQADLSMELRCCQGMRKIELINSNRSVSGVAEYNLPYGGLPG